MSLPFLLYILAHGVSSYVFESDIYYNTSDSNYRIMKPINSGTYPNYWDWRKSNKVSPVKDQMNCNACWAFSAVANIESHLSIYLDQEVILSEQFLIDCDGSGVGCGSTSVLNAFGRIVNHLGGVLPSADYAPYSAEKHFCSWSGTPKAIPVIGFKRVRADEEIMAKSIFKYGPLSAGINSASMRVYKGGIDEPSDFLCSPRELDHAVLIVGYSSHVDKKTRKETPYWIIKNSWGQGWGDRGFYYLIRGRNACGIKNDVSFALVD